MWVGYDFGEGSVDEAAWLLCGVCRVEGQARQSGGGGVIWGWMEGAQVVHIVEEVSSVGSLEQRGPVHLNVAPAGYTADINHARRLPGPHGRPAGIEIIKFCQERHNGD